jgi:hypothetical protein
LDKMRELQLFSDASLYRDWKNLRADPSTQGAAISVFKLNRLGCIIRGDVTDVYTEGQNKLVAAGIVPPPEQIKR